MKKIISIATIIKIISTKNVFKNTKISNEMKIYHLLPK